jgi:membrane protein implicated in regulation of membrane protease activity
MNDASPRSTGTTGSAPRPVYHERLLPGPGAWIAAVGLGVIVAVVVLPLAPLAAPGAGVLVAAGTIAALVATAPVIEVSDGELRAGSAHVPVDLLGPVTPVFSAEEMRVQLGLELDARAYVCLRSWARTGLKVELVDPSDPTPYWLVSTRRPDDLAAAIEEAAAGA